MPLLTIISSSTFTFSYLPLNFHSHFHLHLRFHFYTLTCARAPADQWPSYYHQLLPLVTNSWTFTRTYFHIFTCWPSTFTYTYFFILHFHLHTHFHSLHSHLRLCSCWPLHFQYHFQLYFYIFTCARAPAARASSPSRLRRSQTHSGHQTLCLIVWNYLFVENIGKLLDNWQRGIIQFIICCVHAGHQTLFVLLQSLGPMPPSGRRT